MALTLTAPASSENDTIVVVFASDEGNLINVGRSDFTLRRADTNAVIGSNISIDSRGGSGRNYSWDITVEQTDAYTGLVYLQLAANSVRSLSTLARLPSRAVNSNQFRFRLIPPPDAPSDFAGTVTFESARLTWTSDPTKTYEIRRNDGVWQDATSPYDDTGLSPETEYTWDLRVKAEGFTPPSAAVSLTLTTLVEPPRPAAPANFSIVVTSVQARGSWDSIQGQMYEVRVDSGMWEDATSPHLFTGLTPNDEYVFQVRVKATDTIRAGRSASITITTLSADVFAIELIAEQFILVNTKDYSLSIRIFGNPDKAEAKGLQEGFYQDWDNINKVLYIKSESVDRLTTKAVWTVEATKGSEFLTSTIIYNVTTAVPVIVDPGNFELYIGHDFNEFVTVRNTPTIVTGYSTLVGLKSEPSNVETEGELPVTGILTTGRLLSTARLPFTEFDIDYYAENEHGNDSLSVPVNINRNTFYRCILNYVAESMTVNLTLIAPDNQAIPQNLRVTPTLLNIERTANTNITGEAILSYRSDLGGNRFFVFVVYQSGDDISFEGAVFSLSFYIGNSQRTATATLTRKNETLYSGDDVVTGSRFSVNASRPAVLTPPANFGIPTEVRSVRSSTLQINLPSSVRTRLTATLPAADYGDLWSQNIVLSHDASLYYAGSIRFAFNVNGRPNSVQFDNFDITQDKMESKFVEIR